MASKFDQLSGNGPPPPEAESPLFKVELCVEKIEVAIHSNEVIDDSLLNRVNETEGVDVAQRIGRYTLSVFKGFMFEWDDVQPRIQKLLDEHRADVIVKRKKSHMAKEAYELDMQGRHRAYFEAQAHPEVPGYEGPSIRDILNDTMDDPALRENLLEIRRRRMADYQQRLQSEADQLRVQRNLENLRNRIQGRMNDMRDDYGPDPDTGEDLLDDGYGSDLFIDGNPDAPFMDPETGEMR